MASGHVKVPHQQAEHMAAPTSTASTSNKSLANREPSTHGYKRRIGQVPGTAALPLIADLTTGISAFAPWASVAGGKAALPERGPKRSS